MDVAIDEAMFIGFRILDGVNGSRKPVIAQITILGGALQRSEDGAFIRAICSNQSSDRKSEINLRERGEVFVKRESYVPDIWF